MPVQAGDIVATEHWGMNGFAHTDLDQQPRQHGIDHIFVADLTAPGCVEGTGRWAIELGYAVTLVKDVTAAFSKEWAHATVELNGPLSAEVAPPPTSSARSRTEGCAGGHPAIVRDKRRDGDRSRSGFATGGRPP